MARFGIDVSAENLAEFQAGILKKKPLPLENHPTTGVPWTFEQHMNEKLRDYSQRIHAAGIRIQHDQDVGEADINVDIVDGRPNRV